MIPGLVSVLLTTYNNSSMFLEAIKSVFWQTYKNYELIILDDNSNLDVIDQIKHLFPVPSVKFYKSNIQNEDRWKCARYAAQINIGLKLADGEFVSYLCDDDWYVPARLEKMVGFLNNNPDAHVVCGLQEMMELQNGQWIQLGVRNYRNQNIIHDAYCVVDHSSVMHRRLPGLEEWPIDNVRIADAEFWRKLNKAGYAFYVIPEILDVHRYWSGSISGRMSRNEHLK